MILTKLFIAFELCYGDIDISKGAQFASLPRSLRDPRENEGKGLGQQSVVLDQKFLSQPQFILKYFQNKHTQKI